MVSHKQGNPSERINLAVDTQRGFGETGIAPVHVKRFVLSLLRARNNVSQNYLNVMTPISGVSLCFNEPPETGSFFCLFWGSL